jgi:hypothetical protein
MTENKYPLTPELLKQEGWELIETRALLEKYGCPYNVYRREYSDAENAKRTGGWMMDGYIYTWQLYIPSWETFGTWQGAEIIIEEQKRGGFSGGCSTYTIFKGRCDHLDLLKQISQLVGIKNYECLPK